jgi:hypothetical protein
MNHDWGFDEDPYGPAHPFDATQADNVVPADGDPEAEAYRARVRRQESPASQMFWPLTPARYRRGTLRRWLIAAAVIALGLLFIKPLLVIAAVLVALVVGFVLFVILTAGALLLAARLTLGGRYGNSEPRGRLARAFLHSRRMGPRWND